MSIFPILPGTSSSGANLDNIQISDVSGLQSALESTLKTAQRSVANGVAPLDVNGKVPVVNLPDSITSGLQWQGVWDAATNAPTLPAASSSNGYFYKVNIAGTQNLNGSGDVNYAIGDWLISNGTTWEQIGASDSVISVAGKTGAVSLTLDDVADLQQALDGKESSGSAASAVSAHEAKPSVHTISGVDGLQSVLDGKEESGTAASAVAAHKIEQNAHQIGDIENLAETLSAFGGGGFGGQYKNLFITASGVGYQGTITSDRLIVESGDFKAKVLRNINVAFNGANNGANGLDTGSIVAGNWYYLHVIYNPTSDTTASLISLSTSAPTVPIGYTMLCNVGSVYAAASTSAFRAQEQSNNLVTFGVGESMGAVTLASGLNSSSYVAFSTAIACPPHTKRIWLNLGSPTFPTNGVINVFADKTTGISFFGSGNAALMSGMAYHKTPNTLYYKGASLSGGVIRAIGYEDSI